MNFKDTIKAALEKRETLFADESSNCFRLFNGEGDGIRDLTIDRYGDYLLVQYFSNDLTAGNEPGKLRDDLLKEVSRVAELIPVTIKGILVKNRAKIDSPGSVDFVAARRSRVAVGTLPPAGYTVVQCGTSASVDLVEGQSTGIFLDMREVRQRLEDFYAREKPASMLNLFSYTGMFSVHALLNGAGCAVNIDLSRAVLKKAMENYTLNGLAADNRDFIYGDALSWTSRLAKQKRTFDFIVIDPPTFARHRKSTFSVKKDYPRVLETLGRLAPGGHILTAVNTVSISADEFISYHPREWEQVFLSEESSDFVYRDAPYLKVGLWRQKGA